MLFKQDAGHSSNKKPRRRKKSQRSRIQHDLKQMMQGQEQVTLVGEDLLFRAVLNDLGGEPPTTAPFQVLCNNTAVTVVGIPDRLWNKPIAMARLERARNRMHALGRRCILLPQSGLRPAGLDLGGGSGLLLMLVDEASIIHDLACPPGRRHDPAGCFAHLMMCGASCPTH
ncbi:hypothetical protein [Devosia submarina]|uniref:hypothetical protein n=1 Tax=Devosia submarina TaxID=1173082 RepID=UPI000D38687B|nr:hypothetical protein [Devosia submarina]